MLDFFLGLFSKKKKTWIIYLPTLGVEMMVLLTEEILLMSKCSTISSCNCFRAVLLTLASQVPGHKQRKGREAHPYFLINDCFVKEENSCVSCDLRRCCVRWEHARSDASCIIKTLKNDLLTNCLAEMIWLEFRAVRKKELEASQMSADR